MTKKVKIVLLLISLSLCLGLMSNTYSRYVASTTGDINTSFSKWQILVANTDITNNNNSTIAISPIMEENANIAEDVVAPSSKGYFDIDIDPTNVDVSFSYRINLEMQNNDLPDLIITKYAIVPNDYIVGDSLDIIDLEGGEITNNLLFNKSIESFRFQSFTVRVYFEWFEGTDEQMDDEADTAVGILAASDETSFTITANLSFEQIID